MSEQRTGPGYSLPLWLLFVAAAGCLAKPLVLKSLVGSTRGNAAATVAGTLYIICGLLAAAGAILLIRALIYPRQRGEKGETSKH